MDGGPAPPVPRGPPGPPPLLPDGREFEAPLGLKYDNPPAGLPYSRDEAMTSMFSHQFMFSMMRPRLSTGPISQNPEDYAGSYLSQNGRIFMGTTHEEAKKQKEASELLGYMSIVRYSCYSVHSGLTLTPRGWTADDVAEDPIDPQWFSLVDTILVDADVVEFEGVVGQGLLREVLFLGGSQLASIGDHAFMGCDKLEHCALPLSVASVGRMAFRKCDSLLSINLPPGCAVGTQAYAFCTALDSVTVPVGAVVDYGAFAGCGASRALWSSSADIRELMFTLCEKLATVVVRNINAIAIASNAFQDCPLLAEAAAAQGLASAEHYVRWYNENRAAQRWAVLISVQRACAEAETGGGTAGRGDDRFGNLFAAAALGNGSFLARSVAEFL